MSEIKQNDILDNLRGIDGNETLLDILLEFEHMLDEQGMYGYENWKLGEVAHGPKLSRYWLNVTLMYPYLKMPNPRAALRLENIGCDIKFKKAINALESFATINGNISLVVLNLCYGGDVIDYNTIEEHNSLGIWYM